MSESSHAVAPRQLRGTDGGFSLMEVLVGISILGIVYAALFSLMTTSLKNIGRIEDREKVIQYAQTKLNELVLHVQQGIIDKELSGKLDDRYSWLAEVENFDSGKESSRAPDFIVAKIRLSVLWTNRGNKSSYDVETLTWMPYEEKSER